MFSEVKLPSTNLRTLQLILESVYLIRCNAFGIAGMIIKRMKTESAS